jgi:hypothetical protein
MKLALRIIVIVSLVSFALFYFTMQKPSNEVLNLPWHVKVHDRQHSEVFGVILNKTTLEQARQQFGQLDGIALYQNADGIFNLEAYFGKVTMGPFSARLIANLGGSQQEMENLVEHTIKRLRVEDGDIKWTLTAQKQVEQGLRQVKSLTYIPTFSGMDSAFLEQRFGAPKSRQKIDATTELWLYPEMGLRIMLDSEGKEMFDYTSLFDFETITGD